MRLDPAGRPFIGGALLLALVSGIALGWVPAALFVALSGFFVFFFRDPERSPPADSHGGRAVLAPADGRVLVAGSAEPGAAPSGAWQQISIFLSPMDVHVNRMPVSGQVTRVNLCKAFLNDPGRLQASAKTFMHKPVVKRRRLPTREPYKWRIRQIPQPEFL